ncbi:ImmA/IrrE family metallo-endopeptidase [Cohnella faecalis]|uniref:ImmA/IrrE family metallo-endopeptidase n=1 Tax=Cohnella faecalis TaxID=2315694 RepID=A0A398CKA5_9BACL|nr:ImmA/IrrE family metallo-endopeptidase [Cohnella faecalis]RIE01308.1 ImmA/IrrE family metallo-endopeptidase [Cohnella faecalis]
MPYDRLLTKADQDGVEVYEEPMAPANKGLYADGVIWINKTIPTATEKACILAEELGHYHTTAGNILDQRDVRNRKQEKRARNWAVENLIPLHAFIAAFKSGVRNRFELADFLDVTEEFLDSSIRHYQEKHEFYAIHGHYIVGFDPLFVAEIFEPKPL